MREGLQGFGQTALAGGIPCLLASKWNVLVNESIILMRQVYAYMAMNKVRELAMFLKNGKHVYICTTMRCNQAMVMVCIAMQDKYQTVTEALQAAVVSPTALLVSCWTMRSWAGSTLG